MVFVVLLFIKKTPPFRRRRKFKNTELPTLVQTRSGDKGVVSAHLCTPVHANSISHFSHNYVILFKWKINILMNRLEDF